MVNKKKEVKEEPSYQELLWSIVNLVKWMQDQMAIMQEQINKKDTPISVPKEDTVNIEVDAKTVYEVIAIFDWPEFMMNVETVGTYPTLEEARAKFDYLNENMLNKIVEKWQYKLRYKKFQINSMPVKVYK